MIDDSRLTIGDSERGLLVRASHQSPIPNRQSSIPSWFRRFVASLLSLLLCSVALAQTPRELIEQGNAHFKAGRYAEALEAYAQVGEKPDDRVLAELLHNCAATRFKLGQLDDARELWVRATGLKDAPFEATARYNLGNCNYADALKALATQNAGAALELLDRAAEQYRDALRLDPTLLDARANLELAAQLKKQIEEMAQQQPQTQPSPEQSDQQQGQQDQSTSQPSSQPSSQPGESNQQEQDQDGEQQQDQQPEDGSDEQQDSSQQPSTQPDSQPMSESQPAPQPQPEPSEDEEQLSEQQQPLVPIEMTREEAERLLQMIRDTERQRRAILRAREAARHKPVEKDW